MDRICHSMRTSLRAVARIGVFDTDDLNQHTGQCGRFVFNGVCAFDGGIEFLSACRLMAGGAIFVVCPGSTACPSPVPNRCCHGRSRRPCVMDGSVHASCSVPASPRNVPGGLFAQPNTLFCHGSSCSTSPLPASTRKNCFPSVTHSPVVEEPANRSWQTRRHQLN